MRYLILILAACGSKNEDDTSIPCADATCASTTPEGDTDTDTDSDADTDTDTDTDITDTDTTDTDTGPTAPLPFTLSSPDLLSSAGHPLAAQCGFILPDAFSCQGPNPELAWSGVPAGAVSLMLIFDDPDAGFFPHWAVVNADPATTGFAGGVSGDGIPSALPKADLDGDGVDDGALEILNGSGSKSYLGSCPGQASHIYRWRLYALDAVVPPGTFSGSASQQFGQAEDFANMHTLGLASMCHIYKP